MASQGNSNTTNVGQPAQPPAPTDNSAVGLLVRIANVRTFLGTFDSTLQTRHFLYVLYENEGRYCATCTVRRLPPGTCGPTCALLRPDTIDPPQEGLEDWVQQVKDGFQEYLMIEAEVEQYGNGADEARVSRWEASVRHLKEGDEPFIEKVERLGLVKSPQEFEGMNQQWTFEQAWGGGPGEEEPVPPEVGGPEVEDGHETET